MTGARLPRFNEQLPLRIGVEDAATIPGFSTDVSARGIGFEAAALPDPGERVSIAVTLPEGLVAYLEGIVVWSTRCAASFGMQGRGGLALEMADESYFQLVFQVSR